MRFADMNENEIQATLCVKSPVPILIKNQGVVLQKKYVTDKA
jgi:hypothetical protein